MPNLMKSGRILLAATLAASTMLASLPAAFAAGNVPLLLAQADPGEPPPPPGKRKPPAEGAGGEPGQERPRPRAAEPEGAPRGEQPRPRAAEPEAAPRAEQPRPPKREPQPEPAAREPQPEPQREAPPARRAAPEGEPAEQGRNRPQSAEGAERPAERAPARAAPVPEPSASEAPAPARKQRQQPAEAEPERPAAPSEGEPNGNRRPRQANEPAPTAPPAVERPAEGAEAPPKPRREAPAPAPGNASETPEGTRRPAPEAAPAARQPEQPAEQAPAAAPGRAPAGRTTPATPDASAPREAQPAVPPSGEVPAQPPRPAPGAAEPAARNAPGAPDANTAVPPAPAPAARTAPPAPPPAAGAAPVAPGAAPPAAPAPAGTPGTPAAPRAQGQAAPIEPPPPQDLRPQPVPADIQNAPVQPGRINQSDARVQTLQQPIDVRPITQETGERVREEPRYVLPPDAKVVKRDGDRQILSLGAAAIAGAVAGAAAGYFIRSNDDDRIAVDSSDSYSERLSGGRTRDTIVRENGVQIVTITNRYGDVIRRSRIMPDGREVVLFYDPYGEDAQRPDYYEDPGRDLPPIRLDIPEDRYIVDVDRPDERLYYDTLVAPPVETVERIYSVDEVRRSERIRDKVRRIDLATINFDFASAAISQDQARKLQDLADAIKRIVQSDPGETFLIEGHTDAVGSPEANLILSDKRAESVASALTEYFDVPAENLVTQGYGEQELKVNTQAENRENRRVTVRRITALVKPVATSSR